MDFITQTKEVPVVGSYDVVVCGGGPAGLIAAIAAARGGARTALVERYGFLGGMATAGLVAPISVFNYNGRRIVGGIPWEFVERLAGIGRRCERVGSRKSSPRIRTASSSRATSSRANVDLPAPAKPDTPTTIGSGAAAARASISRASSSMCTGLLYRHGAGCTFVVMIDSHW